MKVLFKFSCYDRPDATTRTTYRVVHGDNDMYYIEEKSISGRGWFRTFKDFIQWDTLDKLWNSAEFKCLFNRLIL